MLFAAGELHGVVGPAIAESDALEQIARALARIAVAAAQFGREKNIFFSGQRGDELIRLEDKADFLAAQASQAIFLHVADLDAVEDDGAGSYGIEPGQQTQESAFAAAGGAHNREELAARDIERDAFQDFHLRRRIFDDLYELPYLYDGLLIWRRRLSPIASLMALLGRL